MYVCSAEADGGADGRRVWGEEVTDAENTRAWAETPGPAGSGCT